MLILLLHSKKNDIHTQQQSTQKFVSNKSETSWTLRPHIHHSRRSPLDTRRRDALLGGHHRIQWTKNHILHYVCGGPVRLLRDVWPVGVSSSQCETRAAAASAQTLVHKHSAATAATTASVHHSAGAKNATTTPATATATTVTNISERSILQVSTEIPIEWPTPPPPPTAAADPDSTLLITLQFFCK